jgi:hypothetical protein
MRFTSDRPYADPEKAARKILEISNSTEAVQDGRIHIEKINGPLLFRECGTPAEYKAGLDLAMPVAGSCFTRVGPSSASLRPVPIYSLMRLVLERRGTVS